MKLWIWWKERTIYYWFFFCARKRLDFYNAAVMKRALDHHYVFEKNWYNLHSMQGKGLEHPTQMMLQRLQWFKSCWGSDRCSDLHWGLQWGYMSLCCLSLYWHTLLIDTLYFYLPSFPFLSSPWFYSQVRLFPASYKSFVWGESTGTVWEKLIQVCPTPGPWTACSWHSSHCSHPLLCAIMGTLPQVHNHHSAAVKLSVCHRHSLGWKQGDGWAQRSADPWLSHPSHTLNYIKPHMYYMWLVRAHLLRTVQ